MRHFAFIGIFTLLFAVAAHAEEAMPLVDYDQVNDTLSVEAKEASLKRVLTLVAMKSGVEVLFDERAEQPLSMTFENQPLKAGLENLLRQSNYAFRYSKADDGKMALVGVKVLPAGEEGGEVVPLAHVAGGFFMHEKGNRMLSAEQIGQREEYNRRWQARINELPPEVREKVTKHAKERLDEMERKKAAREQRSQEMKDRRESRRTERNTRRQERIESMTPEERAAYEARQQEMRLKAQQGQLPWQQEQ